ncbi:uncharacterized protein LOC129181822 [Dunckerocampus dactyliophorus]|uniref:uncharacterized protein LOC129181822 n=1 Tax=Dunckerocampus dactyliophorus TaxID=161453 RepID=UPI002406370E|nr:uncharacterized protein LOC129181822 [Dunckerocampus dactyliophorus]
MGARPLLRVVPTAITEQCVIQLMNTSTASSTSTGSAGSPKCTQFDLVHPVISEMCGRPIFNSLVVSNNFTCFNVSTGNLFVQPGVNASWCLNTTQVGGYFKPVIRADVWWWCGGSGVTDRLPTNNMTGLCALVSFILPMAILPLDIDHLIHSATSVGSHLMTTSSHCSKRDTSSPWLEAPNPTYIDAIGVPRGVPDEYKLTNQVTAGFESILPWVTVNKNVDRINYIHYNLQRLSNQTEEAFRAVSDQLRATSLMAFQNHIALDMLLAEKHGVCAMIGTECCALIPNNTAPGGRLTHAINGLKALNVRMKSHVGVDTSPWDRLTSFFGKWQKIGFWNYYCGYGFLHFLCLVCGLLYTLF